MNDIETYEAFRKFQPLIDRIKRMSFYVSEAQKRYPGTELMTKQELEALTRVYVAIFLDIEDLYKEYKKAYDEYKSDIKTIK